ncbi:MAG: glycosyltransferase family 4 protein [Deinococcales bacterium]
MRVLLIHDYYQQRGGEDEVFEAERDLLTEHGHAVTVRSMHNDAIGAVAGVGLAAAAIWNRSAYRDVERIVRKTRADVVHVHNTFPMTSPAVLAGARAAGARVVQTLHNYRLLCPAATFFRDGRVCEDCSGRPIPWPSVQHACYRTHRSATAVVGTMLTVHRLLGTYRRHVDRFIAPTFFSRTKFVAAGLPPERVAVKPHFLRRDPGAGSGHGGYALYVGRLSAEKGVPTLVRAWSRAGAPPLKIVGDGPLSPAVRALAGRSDSVAWLGSRSRAEVDALLAEAALLVAPSEGYETFGLSVIEALAHGTPVVATDHGALAEAVEPGRTGRLVPAGDDASLLQTVAELLANPADLTAMRPEARNAFERRYTAEANHERLMEIYREALGAPARPAA